MKDILSVVSNHHRGRYKNVDEKEFAENNLEFLFQHINFAGVRLNLYRYKVDSQIYVAPEVYNNGKIEYWSAYPVSEEQSTAIGIGSGAVHARKTITSLHSVQGCVIITVVACGTE